MKIIDAGTSGMGPRPDLVAWEALGLDTPWVSLCKAVSIGTHPREIQQKALRGDLLTSRRNLIVSAPTNGGKSLVGLIVLFSELRGGRVILLEPLRALAREKADQLELLRPVLSESLGQNPKVLVSTGDYRIDNEAYSSPPPEKGEIIVATPERLDAIMRNRANDGWLSTVKAVCIDEAHLVGSQHRGATLECVITTLMSLPAPPRLVLLSATIGNAEELVSWLDPCDVIETAKRWPPLKKQVVAVAETEDPDDVVQQIARDVLVEQGGNVLVFVYQTRSAEKLARELSTRLGDIAGEAGSLAYHSKMPASVRLSVAESYRSGRCRCLVSTTALGLGVNLPATAVIVRDLRFSGTNRLGIDDLLQMMGRAGRGDQEGTAYVLVRPSDGIPPENLARDLSKEILPHIVSQLLGSVSGSWQKTGSRSVDAVVASAVASQLARRDKEGASVEDLSRFFSRTLGGKGVVNCLTRALEWLTISDRALAYCDDGGRYHLTALGRIATLAMIPLPVASGFAQLIRDLLSVDSSDRLLESWKSLDHLIVLALLHDGFPLLRTYSNALADQVDAAMERLGSEIPMLYREWIHGTPSASRSPEVLASLGIVVDNTKKPLMTSAHKMAYSAVFFALVIHDRANGISTEDLERTWDIRNLSGVDERLRDDSLWLLAGVAKMLDTRCFFYHLREKCNADADRIRRVKRNLNAMRHQVYELLEELRYCSPLGALLRSLRSTRKPKQGATVGLRTIERLEAAGITSLPMIAQKSVADLVSLGIRRRYAEQIIAYVRIRTSN